MLEFLQRKLFNYLVHETGADKTIRRMGYESPDKFFKDKKDKKKDKEEHKDGFCDYRPSKVA